MKMATEGEALSARGIVVPEPKIMTSMQRNLHESQYRKVARSLEVFHGLLLNSKYEARNSKQILDSNVPNTICQ
jgi:hypothetical protein